MLGFFELLEVILLHDDKLFFSALNDLLKVSDPLKFTLKLCLTLDEAGLQRVILLLRHHLNVGLRCIF